MAGRKNLNWYGIPAWNAGMHGDLPSNNQSVTIPLPGDGQTGLLVTVESSEYTIGNVHLAGVV
jgi:hypothetical protein